MGWTSNSNTQKKQFFFLVRSWCHSAFYFVFSFHLIAHFRSMVSLHMVRVCVRECRWVSINYCRRCVELWCCFGENVTHEVDIDITPRWICVYIKLYDLTGSFACSPALYLALCVSSWWWCRAAAVAAIARSFYKPIRSFSTKELRRKMW